MSERPILRKDRADAVTGKVRAANEPPAPVEAVAEIAAILSKGYLRLLARKAAPTAQNGPQEPSEMDPEGLDEVGKESVHGDG